MPIRQTQCDLKSARHFYSCDAVTAELAGLHALVVEAVGPEPVLAGPQAQHPLISESQGVIDVDALLILIR